MSSLRPFRLTAWLAAPAAAVLLLTPASLLPAMAHVVSAAQSSPAPSEQTVAATQPQSSSGDQRGLTAKAIDKVKDVANSAGDIFGRVPCRSPKGASRAMGSLPHVANKLIAGKPV